jgi:uncharacterized protein (TIGR03435 family)
MTRTALLLLCFASGAFAQSAPAWDAASVKPSKTIVGHDGDITLSPGRLLARNATLKRLLFEAWQLPYSQITGAAWLDSDEFDIDATPAAPATPAQLRLLLRDLLTERFHLALRHETQPRRVYALVVAKGGPHLRTTPASAPPNSHAWRFHGDLATFASYLSLQLTIPLLDDPTTPSHATGAHVPVLDQTGIAGVFDIALQILPDSGSDPFTVWQRALEEQLGLHLESRRAPVEILVVEHADKLPSAN